MPMCIISIFLCIKKRWRSDVHVHVENGSPSDSVFHEKCIKNTSSHDAFYWGHASLTLIVLFDDFEPNNK